MTCVYYANEANNKLKVMSNLLSIKQDSALLPGSM